MFSRRNISLAAGMAAAVALTAGALIASTADASIAADRTNISRRLIRMLRLPWRATAAKPSTR